jgi:hypothetical protein
MKKLSLGIGLSLIFFICVIICGCAMDSELTKIKGVWKYEQYSGGYLDQILIVGKPRKDAARVEYEDYIAKVLEKRKIDIVKSYTLIPDMNDLNRDNIKRVADASRIKTVLATKVVGVDEKEVLIRQSQKMEYVYTPNGTFMRPYLDGPETMHFTKVRLETGLFEVKSEKLLWSATSAIMNPESADEAIKDFTKAIVQQLMQDGFIRR